MIARSDLPSPRLASPAATLHYTLDFSAAAQHCVDVTVAFSVQVPGAIAFYLPAWSPGSYLIREYARHVEGVRAELAGGAMLPVHKRDKACWQVNVPSAAMADGVAATALLRYRVYGRELSVRTNYIGASFALVQHTASLMGRVDRPTGVHVVDVRLPEAWSQLVCGLPVERSGQWARVCAADYDALLDSPLLCGNPCISEFTVDGVPHALATVGGEGAFDDTSATADAEAVVRANVALWGHVPYQRYVFMSVLVEDSAGGGLEHRDSSVLLTSPWIRSTAAGRQSFNGLMAHEHFHAWNIKRLRPVALGPFDYTREAYTPSLWMAEGLTAYYDDLQVRRAALVDDEAYFKCLASSIEALEKTPGRQHTSLCESSFDAWIKLYRRDENTDNTSVSYYLKGSLVGFVLDAELRRRTHNARSLDDAMRLAYARYSQDTGFAEAQWRQLLGDLVAEGQQAEPAARDFAGQLHAWLDEPSPLDYGPALDWYGLELSWHSAAGEAAAPSAKAGDANRRLGIALKSADGNVVVAQVHRGTPAYACGLNVDDEIIAVQGCRVRADNFWQRLQALSPAEASPAPSLTLWIARHARLLTLTVVLAAPTPSRAVLRAREDATAAQSAARRAWLGG